MILKIRVKEVREEVGMSQTDLSKKSGISRATIWALETGKQLDTTVTTLTSIADALGVGVDALFAPDHSA